MIEHCPWIGFAYNSVRFVEENMATASYEVELGFRF